MGKEKKSRRFHWPEKARMVVVERERFGAGNAVLSPR